LEDQINPVEENRKGSPLPDEDILSPPRTPGRELPLKVTEKSRFRVSLKYWTQLAITPLYRRWGGVQRDLVCL
ncbi:MAG: hypothetical protein QW587_08550, partial [Candidatus Bathyarchaeia archaeon]